MIVVQGCVTALQGGQDIADIYLYPGRIGFEVCRLAKVVQGCV